MYVLLVNARVSELTQHVSFTLPLGLANFYWKAEFGDYLQTFLPAQPGTYKNLARIHDVMPA
ncbi:hypothetical protein ACFLYS_00040 [Chloroflexota bacterium]